MTRESNIALLGKHAWSLLHNPKKLWVNMLSSKYLNGTKILNANKTTTRMSQKGDISIGYDHWIDYGPICDLVPSVDIQDTQLLVKDIFFNGEWHWNLLATILPMDVKRKMVSHYMDGSLEDSVIWGDSSSGIYTTRSAYCWLVHDPLVQVNGNAQWNWIWQLRVP